MPGEVDADVGLVLVVAAQDVDLPINDVHSLGLKTAQGLTFTESFYWDMNDQTRAWSKRFSALANKNAMPSMTQAGNYAMVLHYLKAMEALGGNPQLNSGAATADLTGKACTPNTISYTYDTYMLANGTGKALTKAGGDTWFFLTADYAFGHALERDTTAVVNGNGGKVLGSVKHPINTADFSSFLLQAQSSKAKVVGLANAGGDTTNAIKQAAEFGIVSGGQKLAALLRCTRLLNLCVRAGQDRQDRRAERYVEPLCRHRRPELGGRDQDGRRGFRPAQEGLAELQQGDDRSGRDLSRRGSSVRPRSAAQRRANVVVMKFPPLSKVRAALLRSLFAGRTSSRLPFPGGGGNPPKAGWACVEASSGEIPT
ncbi:hypothetical protein ACVJH7_001117 [Bradyrhizobium elkanii]